MGDIPAVFRQLNDWGQARRPFLLLADFELEQVQALPLDGIDPAELKYQFHGLTNAPTPTDVPPPAPLTWKPSYVDADAYAHAFGVVQAGLHRGDSFLTNLTFPTPIATNWTLADIYHHTQARYKLWWKDRMVVFSPEIFVQIRGNEISTHPMKGTLPGHLPASVLLDDAKERAEHATIVDLMRNDLSQVATDVRVEQYRYAEHLATNTAGLWQTSSRITGQLPSDYLRHLGDILYRLLPAGSVSGAPKAETLRIIRAAEGQKRGYYTGIAALWDGHTLDSCVLIRFVEQTPQGMRYWSGGGITAYSNWVEEYKELKEKVYLPTGTALTNSR